MDFLKESNSFVSLDSWTKRQLQLHVSEKTKMQVEGKLNLEKNKCMAARNLTYGVDAINRIHRNTNNGVFFFTSLDSI